jgi:hypothetical protein
MIAVLVLMVWYAGWLGNTALKQGEKYTIGGQSGIGSYIFTISCLILGGFFNVWMWPQFVYIIMYGVGIGVLVGSGFELTSKHNVWTSIVAYALTWFLYYKGGLFACFNNQ